MPRCFALLLPLLTACTSTIVLGDPDAEGSTGEAQSTSSGPLPTTAAPTTSGDAGSSSGADTSSGPDDTSGDPSCNFLGCTPDVPHIEECDIWNDDCPRGEKCTYWANDGGSLLNATRCVPLDPQPVGPGEPCVAQGQGFDDCAAGSVCWSSTRYPEGECVAFCVGSPEDPDCSDPGSVCHVSGDGLALCIPQCDPLDPQACPEGQACYPVDSSTVCVSDASGEDGGIFEPCEYVNTCDPGSHCAAADTVGQCDAGASSCCTPYCDLTAPSCPEGTQCVPLFDEGAGPPDSENVGSCGVP